MQLVHRGGILWVGFLICICGCNVEIEYPPGAIAPNDPVQERISSAPVFQREGYIIRPLARFSVEARVLSKERYRFDRGAVLSPIDFALGWGPMSDQAVLDQIDISQGGRFYRWQVTQYPIPRRDIIEHSANMHLIPADKAVEYELFNVRVGEVVKLDGYLVKATGEDGSVWKSSLTRKDSGDGACELVWVEQVSSYSPDVAKLNP